MSKKINRPDISYYLAHFTKDKINEDSTRIPASKILLKILTDKKIIASTINWTGTPCTCFTESPWFSLLAHAQEYSPYGIGFEKPRIFAAGGAPVYYVRCDRFQTQNWNSDILKKPFSTPFFPVYTPQEKIDRYPPHKVVDFSHEREWRIKGDFSFEYDQISFVVLKSYWDYERFPQKLKSAIGRKKFLIMESYKMIEKLWPTHLF